MSNETCGHDEDQLLLQQIESLYNAYQEAWERAHPGRYSSTGMAMVFHNACEQVKALLAERDRLRAEVHKLRGQQYAREAYGKTLEEGVLADVISDPLGGVLMVDVHDDLQLDGVQVVLTTPERWRELNKQDETEREDDGNDT
ncbi:MAG: hypothetical protein J7M39_16300 [Anaerolineae bacterium]|nr:hypothetical protein [Anaerolineae bacterium]